MTPDFRILVDDINITERVRNNLLSLTVEDNAGLESDSLTLEIADPDWLLNIPRQGARIVAFLGYKGAPLVYMGSFVADSPEYTIAPNKLTIKAKAADLYNSGAEKNRKSKSWDKTTLGTVVRDVASDMGLEAAVGKDLEAIEIKHIDQTDESNLHFLTRIAKKYGATAKPTGGKLVFSKTGTATSTSGQALPSIALSLSDIQPGARYSQDGRGEYDGVEADWHDTVAAKRKTAKSKPRTKQITKKETTGGENRKKLPGTYASEAEAEAAANAELERLERDNYSFDLTLKRGNPMVKAEIGILTDLTFRKPELIGAWTVRRCTHKLTRKPGYSTFLTMTRSAT